MGGGGFEGFAAFEEVLLGVGADLGAGAGADDFFDLLPVAAVELESWIGGVGTEEELGVFLFGPPSVGGGPAVCWLEHISNLFLQSNF